MARLDAQIQALINYANETTGKADTRLGDAVKSLADGYKGGGRLPKEYQEVEYIESTGTDIQYIDTGVSARNIYKYEAKISHISEDNMYILGAQTTSGVLGRLGILFANNQYMVCFGNVRLNSQLRGEIAISVIVSYPMAEVTINDVVFTINIEGQEITPNNFLILSAQPTNIYKVKARVGEVTIWDNESNKVRNFIPCYRKSDGVIGMYDIVNDTFHTNQGTGTFLKGEDVNVNTSTIPEFPNIENADLLSSKLTSLISYANSITGKNDKTIGDAVRSLAERYGSGIKGYTFHSFLQSDGKAYIDTGIISLTLMDISLDFTPSNTVQSQGYLGKWAAPYGSNTNGLGLTINYQDKLLSYIYGNWNDIAYDIDGLRHTVRQNDNVSYIDGTEVFTAPKRTIGSTQIYLFRRNNAASASYFEGKIHRFTIKDICDFIPASRDSDGVCGMYDLVTDTFFINANTVGTFTVGD